MYDPDTDSIILSRDVVFDKMLPSEGASSSLDSTLLGDLTDTYSSLPPPEAAASSGNDNDVSGNIPDGLSRDIPDVAEPFVPEDPTHTADIPARLRPLRARRTMEESGIQSVPSDWDSDDGPRRSHHLRDCALAGEFLHMNYALMHHALSAREPTHVGEALK